MAKGTVSPGAVLSEGSLKKRRNAFGSSLIAGCLLMLLAAGAAAYHNMTSVSLFEAGLVQHVDLSAVGMDQSDAKAFAESTLAYLQGTEEHWNPVIRVGGLIMPIPRSFTDHMATVKGWFSSATTVLVTVAGIAILLLGRALTGTGKSKKSGFPVCAYYIGTAIPLALLLGIGLWGVFDFNSLWSVLHETLIQDGIFRAAEPIMQLFPLALFQDYLPPIAVTFGILAAIVLVLPLLLIPLSKKIAKLFDKKDKSAPRQTQAGRSR